MERPGCGTDWKSVLLRARRKFSSAVRSAYDSEANYEVIGMLRCRDGTGWGDGTPRILALLAGLLATGPAATAETLLFRNDAKAPVVVQVVSVCRGVYRRDRPYLLRPGEATTPGVFLSGDKIVTIYDAKIPNCVLYQGALPARSLDRRFRILPDAPAPRVRMQPLPSTSR